MTEQQRALKLQDQLSELAKDQEFVTSLFSIEEPEQAQAAFAEKGVALSLDEVKAMGRLLERYIDNEGDLTEEDLEEVSGGIVGVTLLGVIGTWVAVGFGVAGGSAAIGVAIVEMKDNWRKVKNWFRRW